MRGRRITAVGVAMVLMALVPACSSDGDGDGAETPSSDAPSEVPDSSDMPDTGADGADTSEDAPADPIDPSRGIRLVQAGPPPASWDPANNRAQITQLVKAYNSVYDTLLRVDGDDELGPHLATDWKYDSTNTVLTLTLRDDVVFTDGTPFDAEAAKLNLERTKAGASPQLSGLLAPIESIEATSPTELVITLSAPNVKVLWAMASPAASMLSPTAIEEDPESLVTHPIGSGPFVWESQTATDVVFVRNDNYWDTETVFPSRVQYTGAPDGNARNNALLSNSVDVSILSQDIPTPDLVAAVEAGDLILAQTPAVPSLIGINTDVAPLDNEMVREAINLALDRDVINDVLNEGTCAPASQLFTPGQSGYIEDLEYEFNLERARQLMEEAGVESATIQFQSVAGTSTAAPELYASMLAEIGITLEIVQVQIQEVFPNFFGGLYGMSILQLFLAMPDPAFTADYISGPSNPGTQEPELVEMVEAAVALPVDDPGRAAAYEEINQYAFDHSLVIPLCYQTRSYAAHPDVVGLDDIPMAVIGHSDTSRLGMRAD